MRHCWPLSPPRTSPAVDTRAMLSVDPALIAVALAGATMGEVFVRLGLRVLHEAFVDRGYTATRTLVSRDRPGALITDPVEAGARAVRRVRGGPGRSGGG